MPALRTGQVAQLDHTRALTACESSDETGEAALSGEPVAAVEAPAGTNWVDTVQVTAADGQAWRPMRSRFESTKPRPSTVTLQPSPRIGCST